MSWLNDPEVVEREYATDRGLRGRQGVYERLLSGGDAREAAFGAVAESSPRRFLFVAEKA